MEIASIYAQNLRTKSNGQYIPESGSSKGFDEYINKAEARNAQPQKTERDDKTQINYADRYKKVNPRQGKNSEIKNQDNANQELQQPQNENAVKEEKSPTAEEVKIGQVGQTDGNQANKADTVEDMPEIDVTAVNSQIVLNLAQKLDIPVEEVSKLLEKLNIQPLDLMDKEILGSFMRELFGVESNAELLNIPNISEAFTLVNEALSESAKATGADITTRSDKPMAVAVSAEVKQSVGLEPTKDISVNEDIIVDGELTLDASQVVAKPEEAKNANQNTKQDTGSGAGFTQTDGVEVNAEIVNDENVIVMSENAKDSSQVIKTEARVVGERTINQAEVVKQVVEHFKTDVKGNVSEVKMLLKPESLGELTLKISIENGIITAQFTAENQRVKEIIESNFNQLKEALSQSGVEVGALSVSVSSDNEHEAMHAYERERQKSARRISKIIAGINSVEGSEIENKLVSEEDVLETQVNYTV